jgi:hypothetical protein
MELKDFIWTFAVLILAGFCYFLWKTCGGVFVVNLNILNAGTQSQSSDPKTLNKWI